MSDLDKLLGINTVKPHLEEDTASITATPHEPLPSNATNGASPTWGAASPTWGADDYLMRYAPIYRLISTMRTLLSFAGIIIGAGFLAGLLLMTGKDSPPALYIVLYSLSGVLTVGFILALRTALLLGVVIVDTAVHSAPIQDKHKKEIIRMS